MLGLCASVTVMLKWVATEYLSLFSQVKVYTARLNSVALKHQFKLGIYCQQGVVGWYVILYPQKHSCVNSLNLEWQQKWLIKQWGISLVIISNKACQVRLFKHPDCIVQTAIILGQNKTRHRKKWKEGYKRGPSGISKNLKSRFIKPENVKYIYISLQ